MATITQFATVSETGILQINPAGRKRMQADLIKFAGKSVEISIKVKNRRSTQQNRYLWGVVYKEVEIELNRLGNDFDSDTIHDFFKDMFLKVPIAGPDGEQIGTMPGKTSELNKTEFSEYVEKIAKWCGETLGLCIPMPGEKLQLHF